MAWAATASALRPVAEAEARERAFVCTASHGLVTPLMAVTANCDVLEAEVSDQTGLASWVANIRAAADEMATHIADMLMHMGFGFGLNESLCSCSFAMRAGSFFATAASMRFIFRSCGATMASCCQT